MATTVLRFSDSFWDEEDRGIDILTEKLTNSEQTCQDLKKIYEIRAQIEKDYGERLLELSHYTLGEIELGTLAASMQRIPFAFETTARAHIDMAEQLSTTLEVPLTSFLKEQCELINARSHQMENSKHLKDIHQAHVDKAKQAYDEIQDLLKQKQANGEDVETVNNSLALADRDWQHSVEILQEVTDKFSLDWKITCDLYQDLEERRINFIRSNAWAFANMMSSVYIVDDRGCEGIRTGLEATDVRKDINDFILKYGTSVKMSPNTTNNNQSDPYPSPESTQNESSHPGTTDDSMTFAFQEVENMLSDPNVMKRSSLDQQPHYSSQSPHKSSFSSASGTPHKGYGNSTTPRDSLDNNPHEGQHQRQLSATSVEPHFTTTSNYSSPNPPSTAQSPPQMIAPTAKEIPSASSPASYSPQQNSSSALKTSPTLGNDHTSSTNISSIPSSSSMQRLSNTSNSSSSSMERKQRQPAASQQSLDDSDDDDEPRRPVRVPKPREEKWTISARRTGPSTTTRPTNNGAASTTNTTGTGIQPLPATNQKIKNGYLDPTIHPPPLQQQHAQQQYYGATQPQASSSLYPPEQYTSSQPSSKRNSGSSFYRLTPSAASSASSLTVDVTGTQKQPSSTTAASQKPITYPTNNAAMMYQPTATTYQPSTAMAPTAAYRPPPATTSAAMYRPPSATTTTTTIASTYQPVAAGSTTTYRPTIATTTTTIPPYQPTSTTVPAYHPVSSTSYHHRPPPQPSSNNQAQSLATIENLAQHSGAKIGIRPPEWQDQRQGELDDSAASDYMKGEGAPTSPARSGLQRYNSVNGPREPPAKDNYIASSELKNTRGFGEETVTILEDDGSASINELNKKKKNDEATDTSAETKDDPKKDETTTTTTTATTTTTTADADTTAAAAGEEQSPPSQETPKSGFSFNNIFFRKDKPSSTDDGLRLPDGTTYKHKVRAMWSYEAKIDSELSFQANDSLAVIRKQPDGWWEAEIMDDKRRKRGLVPGNYMSLN